MSGFLNFKMAPWKRSCVTRTVAIVPTLIIAVVFQASHKLDQLNQLLNILQSIMLPFAIIPVSHTVCTVWAVAAFASAVYTNRSDCISNYSQTSIAM